jgi:SAM-dependent methyltransferase
MAPPNPTARSYDAVAAEYTARIAGELAHKPFDRSLLDAFAARVSGPVADVGCGPGHVGAYLSERAVPVTGIDLSDGMLAEARRLYPGIAFERGDMTALAAPDGAWAGIVAFYSIIHLPRAAVPEALRELRRTLRPGGLLLLAFHVGSESRHLDELWGHAVDVDFHFFESAEMTTWLQAAGFEVESAVERDPYAPDVEHQSRRAYVLAVNPLR